MQKTFSRLVQKLEAHGNISFRGGFYGIVGGTLNDNSYMCTNSISCNNSNTGSCSNQGLCSGTTNSAGCKNAGACLSL
jgi:hypothetical protein